MGDPADSAQPRAAAVSTGLPLERIRRVVAGLGAGGSSLSLTIEAADGSPLIGPDDPAVATARGTRVTRELRPGGRLAGRLVATTMSDLGPGGPADALVDALAVAIEELIDLEASTRHPSSAPGTVDPATFAADLAMSRTQQRTIVSLRAPDVPGYELASYYEPARQIGGDFFELFRIRRRGHPLGIVIADVAGKGIAAALLMAFARPVIHTALTAASGPAEALERTNRILVDELRTALFITALTARLELKTGIARVANAGHELPLMVPGDGGPLTFLAGGGPLMGAFARLAITESEVELRPGDQLLLYTDGVTDMRSVSGERFGRDRLLATVERGRGGTADELVAVLRDELLGFAGTADPADDVTIVVVGRRRG